MSETTDFYTPSEEQIVLLQSILQKQSLEPVSQIETKEIGIQLISLFECLARDRSMPVGAQDDTQRR